MSDNDLEQCFNVITGNSCEQGWTAWRLRHWGSCVACCQRVLLQLAGGPLCSMQH